jgi:hypothetical protein
MSRALSLVVLAALFAGCTQEGASAGDCRLLLDRIVAIELAERGFRDPVLLRRKQEDLARLLGRELKACEGRPLPREAKECARRAPTQEVLSHRCLR